MAAISPGSFPQSLILTDLSRSGCTTITPLNKLLSLPVWPIFSSASRPLHMLLSLPRMWSSLCLANALSSFRIQCHVTSSRKPSWTAHGWVQLGSYMLTEHLVLLLLHTYHTKHCCIFVFPNRDEFSGGKTASYAHFSSIASTLPDIENSQHIFFCNELRKM